MRKVGRPMPQVTETLLFVQGDRIVDFRSDFSGRQVSLELIAAPATNHVLVVDMIPVRQDRGGPDVLREPGGTEIRLVGRGISPPKRL